MSAAADADYVFVAEKRLVEDQHHQHISTSAFQHISTLKMFLREQTLDWTKL
jgi:hypothetical protein